MTDRPSVVMIDDEPEQLVVMEALLSDDFDTHGFTSGRQAIAALEQWPDSVVLCDQRMPDLSGDEVLTRIRVLYPRTVRVMVTGHADLPALVRALNEGSLFGYLQKPYEPEQLKALVHRAVRSQEVVRENLRLQQELQSLQVRLDALVEQRTASLVQENVVLREMAERDALTGLFNARALHKRLQEEQERVHRYGEIVSLVMIDLDHFKDVNDTWGHLVGDAVLREVGMTLRRTVRQGDFVGRYGGEEFLVIAPGTPEEGAVRLAERLRASVESIAIPAGPETSLRQTISLGVATGRRGEEASLQEVLRRADECLYRAKRDGRNRVLCWSQLKFLMASRPQSVFVARTASETGDHRN
ncbi:diguanylate cyclase [Myxococcota bacterium]|nr:diguanylate cyclase [Myxococcota bacterium]